VRTSNRRISIRRRASRKDEAVNKGADQIEQAGDEQQEHDRNQNRESNSHPTDEGFHAREGNSLTAAMTNELKFAVLFAAIDNLSSKLGYNRRRDGLELDPRDKCAIPSVCVSSTPEPIRRAHTTRDLQTDLRDQMTRAARTGGSPLDTGAKQARTPVWFQPENGGLLFFAGLYEEWRPQAGQSETTFTILTCDPNAVTRPIHNRMPVILPDAKAQEDWINPRERNPLSLKRLLLSFRSTRPAPTRALSCRAGSETSVEIAQVVGLHHRHERLAAWLATTLCEWF